MAPSTLHMLIFGGLSLVSASFLMYFMFWRKPSVPAIKDKKDEKPVEKAADKVEKPIKQQPEVAKKSEPAPVPDVIVEDADSDEDEEEEAEVSSTIDVELEELKTKYEDANRLASKLISGQSYEKAVAKLTEAIELAPQIPNAGKDIMTLYNNRSAMYEKLSLYDKSLSDITVILTMDVFHMKARVRRARVFEAQEKIRQALDEYVFAALQEQRTGAPPSHQLKIDTLAKTLALKGTPALFKSLRQSSTKRPLPSKSHCKNFLESYPSVHLWIDHFKDVERSTLVAAVAAAEEVDDSVDAVERDTTLRGAQLTLIAFDLVNSRFESAFEALHSMKAATADPLMPTDLNENVAVRYMLPYDNTNTLQLLSLQYELIGFEAQLRCDLSGAIAAFTMSLQFCPGNYDTRLKLGNVYLELPNLGESSRVFEEMLAHLRQLETSEGSDKEVVAILKAWTLLHRVSLFVTRNDKGEFSPTAIADSQRDVEEALALTEELQNTLAGKAARVTALIRSVHIVVQSKPMVGEAVSEEDADKSKAAVAAAKLLAPYNDSVMMIDAELLNNEGRADEALTLIQAAQLRPDAVEGDCTPYCLRASILINKAMTLFQNATSQEDYNIAQAALKESEGLYKKALELEPQAIEALNQYAQYCGMMGELATAVDLLKQALPLARTRDDVHDLNQVLILNEAQLKAVESMRAVLNVQ